MNVIRSIAKKIPGLRQVYVGYLNFADRQRLKGKTPEKVFTEIYEENRWGNNESVSGPGSAAIHPIARSALAGWRTTTTVV